MAIQEYGTEVGIMIWDNTLPNMLYFDLNIEEHRFHFDLYCTRIYDCMAITNSRHAKTLFRTDRFWSTSWQHAWQNQQYVRLFLQVVAIFDGEALRQAEEHGVANARTIRAHFITRFSDSHTNEIKIREKAYLLGMRDKPGGMAFPPYCDMVKKLNQLETEKTYFTKACPIDMRSTYKYCQEKTLVSMIIEHLPIEYDSTVKDVRNVIKMRKILQGDSSAGVTTDQDLRFQNFCEDWVPPYKEIRTALVDSYLLMKKRWDKDARNDSRVPAMMLVGGHPQPGSTNIVCCACGIEGHKRSDSVCDAKPDDIWEGAPKSWITS